MSAWIIVLLITLFFCLLFLGYIIINNYVNKSAIEDDNLLAFFMGAVSIFLSILFTWFIISAVVNRYIDEIVLKEEIKIVSLDKKTELNANFILGCGYASNEIYYYTYMVLGNNQYKLVKFKSDNVIIEESNKEPCIMVYENYKKWDYDEYFFQFYIGYFYKSYVFIVPFGSIIRDFKL
jgi:hypothetical protein